LNANSSRLLMCKLASRWTNMRLCIVTSFIVSFIALIIFLLRDVVPTSYAGAALIYAFQVCGRPDSFPLFMGWGSRPNGKQGSPGHHDFAHSTAPC